MMNTSLDRPRSTDQLILLGKQKISTKLNDLKKERDEIVSTLNAFLFETTAIAQPLLMETDRSKFRDQFEKVSQILETRLNKLFLINFSLSQKLFTSDNEDSEHSFSLEENKSNSTISEAHGDSAGPSFQQPMSNYLAISSPSLDSFGITNVNNSVNPDARLIEDITNATNTALTPPFNSTTGFRAADCNSLLPISEPNISDFGYEISEPDDIPERDQAFIPTSSSIQLLSDIQMASDNSQASERQIMPIKRPSLVHDLQLDCTSAENAEITEVVLQEKKISLPKCQIPTMAQRNSFEVNGCTKYNVKILEFLSMSNFGLEILDDISQIGRLPCSLISDELDLEAQTCKIYVKECRRLCFEKRARFSGIFFSKSSNGIYSVVLYVQIVEISMQLVEYLNIWGASQPPARKTDALESAKPSKPTPKAPEITQSLVKPNYRDREGSILQPVISSNNSSECSTPDSRLDWEATVPIIPSEEVKDPNGVTGIMSLAVSPREFYIQISNDNLRFFESLQQDINQYYQNFTLSQPVHMTTVISVDSYWAAKPLLTPDDQNWYRVKVLKYIDDFVDAASSAKFKRRYKSPMTKVLVLVVDYGNKCELPLRDLFPLLSSFASYPAFAICCALCGVQPLNSQLGWTAECTQRFRELVTEEKPVLFKAICSESPNSYIGNLFTYDEEKIELNSTSVAVQLGIQGMLLCNVSKEEETIAEHEAMNSWRPTQEDFFSGRNRYDVDIDDAEVAVTGYKRNDEKYICIQYRNKGFCHRGDRCRYQHINTPAGNLGTQDVAEEFTGQPLELPNADPTKYLFAMVSTAYSPGHFYLIFPFGYDSLLTVYQQAQQYRLKQSTLELLNAQLKVTYEPKLAYKSDTRFHFTYGTLMAAKSQQDGCWYRAIVVDDDEHASGMVEVSYVDYGNTEFVPVSHVRPIQPEFIHLKYQAIECFLSNSSLDTKWSDQAFHRFQEVTEGKILKVRVLSQGNDNVEVELSHGVNGRGFVNIATELSAVENS